MNVPAKKVVGYMVHPKGAANSRDGEHTDTMY